MEQSLIPPPANFESTLRSKIQEIFLGMIPRDRLDEIIRAEWKSFTVEKMDRYGNTEPSGLQKLIKKEIESWAQTEIAPMVRNRLEEMRQSLAGQDLADTTIRKLTTDCGKTLLQLALDGLVLDVFMKLQQAFSSLQYNR